MVAQYRRSILYVHSVTNKCRLNVPSGTIKRRLNARPRPHVYIAHSAPCAQGVPSAKHEVCCVQKACRLQNCHTHNVHTNVHTTYNKHTMYTQTHISHFQTHKHTDTIFIIKRSPATLMNIKGSIKGRSSSSLLMSGVE